MVLGEVGVTPDVGGQVGTVGFVEDAGTHIERFGGDLERLGDALEDVGRRSAQPPFDLAEVRVRDAGAFGQLAQGQLRCTALLGDELSEVTQSLLKFAHTPDGTATVAPSGRPGLLAGAGRADRGVRETPR